jgi:Domain of unknown function (DUF4432)
MSLTQLLTDSQLGVWLDHWSIGSRDSIFDAAADWNVTKTVLHGGRQEGVDCILVNNGRLQFSVIPTRGFLVWEAKLGSMRLGWDSPVREVVHPHYVTLTENGGLGWLDGFGELVSRCGLESIGAPCTDSGVLLPLHGRINYLPASRVTVEVVADPTPTIRLRGEVVETRMFGARLRLTAEIETRIGSNEFILRDTIANEGGADREFQYLYHANFGPPILEAGARLVVAAVEVAPRDKRAAERLAEWDQYTGPSQPGYTEEVYYITPQASENGQVDTLLHSADKSRGVSVSYNSRELAYLTLWKNEAPLANGYVTGIEPATSLPNPRPFEREAGRVPKLRPGENYRSSITIRALGTQNEVEEIERKIRTIRQDPPEIQAQPVLG